jgi:N-acyl-D-amino-acid deacylase
MLDLIIQNGKIVDGSGNPWYDGDVGIKEGRIVLMGRIRQEAVNILDAQGKVVCPGFIDAHSHADLAILDPSLPPIKLRQGVTTEVFGNCGFSLAPVSPQYEHILKEYTEPFMGSWPGPWNWPRMADYMDTLSRDRKPHHVATLVGNGTLRIHAKGFHPGRLSSEEMDHILYHLEEGLEAGALGLSMGLMYTPENFYAKEELVQICRALSKYDALLTVHLRGEGKLLIPSIQEALSIARESGVPLHISHFKAAGRRSWGATFDEGMERIETARLQGLDVTCDVYPYHAGSSSFTSLLPPWPLEGGIEHTLERLQNRGSRARIREELEKEADTWDNLVCSTGWDHVLIASTGKAENRSWVGKSVAQIAEERKQDEPECALDLFLEDGGRTSIVFFHMSEADVKKAIAWDLSCIVSDSLYNREGNPHPRLYGTFPRLFAKYVREEKILSLEEAVRKVTSFPARRFRLGKRGLLAPGYEADITVFDPEKIADRATHEDPRQYPDGIEYVIINGSVVLGKGAAESPKEGRLLYRS